MYPTGRWRGFWKQAEWGRQPMHGLTLQFATGRIHGQGSDVIGPFTFDGAYDDNGQVSMVKRYVGAHSVLYTGNYDGEGTIFGHWSIGESWRGPFALKLEGYEEADVPILMMEVGAPNSR